MSVEQLEQQVLALSPDERLRFAEWFDDHRHEIVPGDETPVAQQEELLRRRQEFLDHPERFERVRIEAEVTGYLEGIRREVHARVSSARPG
ncbi:MAG: hypothetical protein EBS05_11890 [Proteobacteria bacterium]|nr:hypothetical protein [Pseudomonadota bacterium]